MTRPRLALAADDKRLDRAVAATVENVLRTSLGQGAVGRLLRADLDTVREYLGPDSDGILLLACAGGDEARRVVQLVQEISLRRLPSIILALQEEGPHDAGLLDVLEPHVARRLRWPADAAALAELLRERVGRVNGFRARREEGVEEVIRRRLLALTPSLLPLIDRIGIAARHDVTVLMTGETGTGKTYLAQLMHDCSPRRDDPFLVVPCGAIPANLIESTFFGHVRGAFTGADRNKVGKFEAAGRGTLLLDEIDTLPLEQQAGLLRVMETGEFEPLGSNETRRCEARLIVASNWDLEEAVEARKFREDLYYRLNVMSFHLPPLRERVQDITPLARGLAARFNTKFGKGLFDLSPELVDLLEAFPWPGNIRQLENVVQQAVLISDGPELLAEHLPAQVREATPNGPRIPAAAPDSLLHNREVMERNLIQRALASHGYSRVRTANSLGISRVTLYKKMKKYGLMEEHVQ
jgi:two-component system response regulator HydG